MREFKKDRYSLEKKPYMPSIRKTTRQPLYHLSRKSSFMIIILCWTMTKLRFQAGGLRVLLISVGVCVLAHNCELGDWGFNSPNCDIELEENSTQEHKARDVGRNGMG